MKKFLMTAAVLGVAASVLVGTPNPVEAAPLNVGHAETLKAAAPNDTVNVRRWYRRGGYWAGAAVGGFALGAALAAPYYYNRPYGGYYAYGPAPRQQCWVQTGPYRGQGYWGWC